ncbi:Lrp/AsnC family transcriptional regulator [Streptomyces sp. NPDC058373]|uniref:Lrp/AsnC family transcriptional regulator n=1 Tax=Streptomyces sp. NPDC058373 TaxID=3346465 RepID=UPI00364E4EAC
MTVTLAGADLDLVAALQHAPRAGVRQLAEVLQTSPSTVSRRLGRLREAGTARVIGQVNSALVADVTPDHVWLKTAPGRTREAAEAVARLPETQFAALVSGSSDVYAIVQAPRRADSADLLAQRIGGIPGVVASRTETVLGSYATAANWRLPRLTQPQRDRLCEDSLPSSPPTEGVTITEDERAVVELLHDDGRTNAGDISRTLGLSQSTAYRLLHSVLDRGLVLPRVEIEPALVGYPVEPVIALTTDLSAIVPTATALGRHRAARYVSTVAGVSSLIFHGAFEDEAALSTFITQDLARLDGVRGIDICLALDVLTRYWLPRRAPYLRQAAVTAARQAELLQ